MFKTAVYVSLILNVCRGCTTYTYKDWTGDSFDLKSTTEKYCVLDMGIFGGCWTWADKCLYTDPYNQAQSNVLEQGWDMDKCRVTPDGCSVPSEVSTGDFYMTLFEPVCNIHDWCYSNSDRSKADCDLDFLSNLVKRCEFNAGGINDPICESAAGVYYGAVSFPTVTNHPEWHPDAECYYNQIAVANNKNKCLTVGTSSNNVGHSLGSGEYNLFWMDVDQYGYDYCVEIVFENGGITISFAGFKFGRVEYDAGEQTGNEIGKHEWNIKIDPKSNGDPFAYNGVIDQITTVVQAKYHKSDGKECPDAGIQWDSDKMDYSLDSEIGDGMTVKGHEAKLDCYKGDKIELITV